MAKTESRSEDAGPSEDVLRRMRVPMIRRASLRVGGRSEETFMIDLALSGIFVERQTPLEIGQEIDAEFCLPENEVAIAVRCRVTWWHPPATMLDSKDLPSGLGLEFVDMSSHDQDRVRRYLESYFRRDTHARRFVRHDIPSEEGEP